MAPEPRTIGNATETACRLLEDLWDAGQRPDVGQLLAEAGISAATGVARVLALDQWRRWQAGERVRAEDYLERFPQVAADSEAALELVYGELLVREELGEQPAEEEYLARFPQWSQALRQQLQLHHNLIEATAGYGTQPDSSDTMRLAGRGAGLVPLRAPPKVPGYEILELLGRGGMAVVYKAKQLRLKRLVALKMIGAAEQAKPLLLQRFRSETEAVARLQHPNIVQIYETGEYETREGERRPFCSLELMEGGSLDKKLAGTPQAPEEAAQLVATIAGAAFAAHQRGIIHRDLKPANVLLTAEGVPKISDFGLAKQLDNDSVKTSTGVILGTPRYMAPEQAFAGGQPVGPLADVYALGAILYELLTGRPPFQGASVFDTLEQVREHEPVPPRSLQPKVPADLETICLKCLRKEPAQRYSTARELADDLQRFLAGQPILARPVRAWERVFKWVKRRPALAALAAVSFLGLFSLAVVSYLYRAAQNQTLERERGQRAEVRESAQRLIAEGQAALATSAFDKARDRFATVLDSTRADPSLEELHAEAQHLFEQASGQQNALEKYGQFVQKRDEALFFAILSKGSDSETNLRQAQQAAAQALGKFGVSGDFDAPPTVEPALDSRSADIKNDCYELLLILAETEAHSHTERALKLLTLASRFGPETRAYHLRRARYLEQQGDPITARAEKQKASRREPTSAMDYYLVGDDLYQDDDIPQAIEHFEAALRQRPDFYWARYFLAVCYLRQQRPAEAKACLTACLGQDQPVSSYQNQLVWIYLMRGFACGQLQEFPGAEKDFREASQRLAGHPNAQARYVLHANRGVMRLVQTQALQPAVTFSCGAALWYRLPALHAGIARTCWVIRLAEAEADLRRAIALDPTKYQPYIALSYAHQMLGQWEAATSDLSKAISREPTEAALYRSRARVYQERQLWAAALADRTRAITLDMQSVAPNQMELAADQAERGRLLHRMERYQEAVEAYQAALTANKRLINAHLWRAEALLRLKSYEEAVAAFDAYLAANGQPQADFFKERAVANYQLGRYEQAIHDCARYLESEPRHVATRARRAWSYLACNAPQLALPDFETVLSLEPENGNAHRGRALALAKLGQAREAIGNMEKALRCGPESAALFFEAAQIFARAGALMDAETKQANEGNGMRSAAHYQRQAIRFVVRALTLLPDRKSRTDFWRQQIQKDQVLRALCQSPEYAWLAKRYVGENR
jgi:tetratricopeptide (TPR) repeat protein